MYTIRSLAAPQRLEITITGAAGEQEILRLISQAAALAEADGSQYVCCDIREMAAAPVDTYPISAALAVAEAQILRVAVVTGPETDALVRTLMRTSATTNAVRIFRTREHAMAWIQHCADAAARSSTALRHAAALNASHRRETRGPRLQRVGSTSAA